MDQSIIEMCTNYNKCIDEMYTIYDVFDKEVKVIVIERQEYTLDEFEKKFPNVTIESIPKM